MKQEITPKKPTDKKEEPLNLLSAFERVSTVTHRSTLDDNLFKSVSTEINYICNILDLSRESALMLSLFMDHCQNDCIFLSSIISSTSCGHIQFIKYEQSIDILIKRGYIEENKFQRERTFCIPQDVKFAFANNKQYTIPETKFDNSKLFFIEVSRLFGQRKSGKIGYNSLKKRIYKLLNDNEHFIFCSKVLGYGFPEDDTVLLLFFCYSYIIKHDNNICLNDIEFIFDDDAMTSSTEEALVNEGLSLQVAKVLEYTNDNGYINTNGYRLSFTAKKELFAEMDINVLDESKNIQQMIMRNSIVEKELFYDNDIIEQLDDLSGLLNHENYTSVNNRLRESGFRCGFSCLFYGAPGTGKTETVLQLAKRTQRDIMTVNISDIKDKYFGESEKNLKNIFDSYRRKVEESEVTPILLFNEADAVINKRSSNPESSTESSLNSMQNIILQEMENLNGILIATTNMAENLDKAFERRFLYKLKFNKPSVDVREKIWKSMLKDIDDQSIHQLASRYDFSGGEIENIARHATIFSVLHNKPITLENLIFYCDKERLSLSGSILRMGYN